MIRCAICNVLTDSGVTVSIHGITMCPHCCEHYDTKEYVRHYVRNKINKNTSNKQKLRVVKE